MKHFNSSAIVIAIFLFVTSCDKNEYSSIPINKIQSKQIENRADEECDMCAIPNEETCCCKVTLNSIASIDLHICGVLGGTNENESCSMSTGAGPCYTFGNRGINVSLRPSTSCFNCLTQSTFDAKT